MLILCHRCCFFSIKLAKFKIIWLARILGIDLFWDGGGIVWTNRPLMKRGAWFQSTDSNSDGNERQAKIILSFGIHQNYSLYPIPIEIVFFFIYLPWSKQWNMPKLSAASSIECKLSHCKRGKRAKHWQEDSWAVTSSNQSKNERRILLVEASSVSHIQLFFPEHPFWIKSTQ